MIISNPPARLPNRSPNPLRQPNSAPPQPLSSSNSMPFCSRPASTTAAGRLNEPLRAGLISSCWPRRGYAVKKQTCSKAREREESQRAPANCSNGLVTMRVGCAISFAASGRWVQRISPAAPDAASCCRPALGRWALTAAHKPSAAPNARQHLDGTASWTGEPRAGPRPERPGRGPGACCIGRRPCDQQLLSRRTFQLPQRDRHRRNSGAKGQGNAG